MTLQTMRVNWRIIKISNQNRRGMHNLLSRYLPGLRSRRFLGRVRFL